MQHTRQTISRRIERFRVQHQKSNQREATAADEIEFIYELISSVREQGSLLSSPPPTVQTRSLFVAVPPAIMQDDESKIVLQCPLIPDGMMPFGIVCTLVNQDLDGAGLLKDRLSIRIPLWDENDYSFYKARLSSDGGGIILAMPATSSYLRKIGFVDKVSQQRFGPNDVIQRHHNRYCNAITDDGIKAGNEGVVRVLLRFPKGQTYNNASFNTEVDPGDPFTLQRKRSVFVENALNGLPQIRATVAFEAAKDTAGMDVKAIAHAARVDDVTSLLNMLSTGP